MFAQSLISLTSNILTSDTLSGCKKVMLEGDVRSEENQRLFKGYFRLRKISELLYFFDFRVRCPKAGRPQGVTG